MGSAMQQQVREARLYDVAVTTMTSSSIPPSSMRSAACPTSRRWTPESSTRPGYAVGNHQQDAVIWGIDLADQPVDRVAVTSGSLPGPGELLSDQGNASEADLTAVSGDQVSVRNTQGAETSLHITGMAHSLATSPSSAGSDDAVFYGSEATVRSLAHIDGVNQLAFRLVDNSPAAQTAAVAAIQHFLEIQTGRPPFVELPQTLVSGSWPGQSNLSQILAIFDVITVLAIVCALFLIASTMNTLVVEQATEIAVLKTLGGRKRQIRRIVLRTAALIGAGAALVGTALGAGIAWLLTSYFAWSFFGVHAGFGVVLPVIVISLLLGPVLAMGASLPGLRRALRRPVAEALADHGVTGYGRAASTGWWLAIACSPVSPAWGPQCPASEAPQCGHHRPGGGGRGAGPGVAGRGEVRHHHRQPGLLEPALRRVAAIERRCTVIDAGPSPRGQHTWGGAGRAPGRERGGVPGNAVPGLRRRCRSALPVPSERRPLVDSSETSSARPVVVLGPAIARTIGARVGQTLDLTTAAGPSRVRVVGIDTGQMDNGSVLYFPLSFLQQSSGMGDSSNLVWLRHGGVTPLSIGSAIRCRPGWPGPGFPYRYRSSTWRRSRTGRRMTPSSPSSRSSAFWWSPSP